MSRARRRDNDWRPRAYRDKNDYRASRRSSEVQVKEIISVTLPALHAGTHQNSGSDEINVAGLSGLLADQQDPLAHASRHENGGVDEIDVTGLSGLLADAQTPLSHAATHQDSGTDEISVAGLSGELADAQKTEVSKTGASVGIRPEINLIDGNNVTVAVADDNPNDRLNVTIGLTKLRQEGSVVFAGVTATVVFATAFSATPVVVGNIVKTGSIQGWAITAKSATGFTATRSAPAGAATFDWIAIGTP